MRLLRATTTFVGLVTTLLLIIAFSTVLRGVLLGKADHGLALMIPFLIFAATLVAMNSGLFAAILSGAGLVLFGMALVEDGITALKAVASIGSLVTLTLCIVLARSEAGDN